MGTITTMGFGEPEEPQKAPTTAEEFKPLYRNALQNTHDVLAAVPVALVQRAAGGFREVAKRG